MSNKVNIDASRLKEMEAQGAGRWTVEEGEDQMGRFHELCTPQGQAVTSRPPHRVGELHVMRDKLNAALDLEESLLGANAAKKEGGRGPDDVSAIKDSLDSVMREMDRLRQAILNAGFPV